jgi:hypothetical protein
VTRLRRIAGFLAPALLAMSIALPAVPAAAHSPDPLLSGGLYPQNQALRFRWAPDAVPPAAARTAFLDAAAGSNATRASKAPTFTFDAGATNDVAYGGAVPCGVNGIACMRRDAAAGWFGVWFRPHGQNFDWGVLRWCQLLAKLADGCYDMENVMLDELGHVLVLGHHENHPDASDYLDAVVQTYSRTRPRAGWNAHVYGRCDVATLQRQYDVLGWSTPYSTCLDLPTLLPMNAGASSVPYGGTATFTAWLKVGDGYGRLSQNPVADRVVVLQRRAGGTVWSDMVVMNRALPAGTYTAAVTVTSTGEWRAIFRKPTSEGLRAATSPAITVTVTGGCTSSPCPLSAPGPGARK